MPQSLGTCVWPHLLKQEVQWKKTIGLEIRMKTIYVSSVSCESSQACVNKNIDLTGVLTMR